MVMAEVFAKALTEEVESSQHCEYEDEETCMEMFGHHLFINILLPTMSLLAN